MDLSRLVHNYRPSGIATISGGIVQMRLMPSKISGDQDREVKYPRTTAAAPQESTDDQPLPAGTHAGTYRDAAAADPSSPLSYLSRTPSLSPAGAPEMPSTTAKGKGKGKGKQKENNRAHPERQLHIQARLAQTKAELARIYKTKDRTAPRGAAPLSPSLAVGPFVRYMARVFTEDIQDVRIQKHLRENIMTPAHFNELMIWHGRAVVERREKAEVSVMRAGATRGRA